MISIQLEQLEQMDYQFVKFSIIAYKYPLDAKTASSEIDKKIIMKIAKPINFRKQTKKNLSLKEKENLFLNIFTCNSIKRSMR